MTGRKESHHAANLKHEDDDAADTWTHAGLAVERVVERMLRTKEWNSLKAAREKRQEKATDARTSRSQEEAPVGAVRR